MTAEHWFALLLTLECLGFLAFDLWRRNGRWLWAGWCGFGFVWRGTEHQFYRDCDGSMGKRWTHHTMPEGP